MCNWTSIPELALSYYCSFWLHGFQMSAYKHKANDVIIKWRGVDWKVFFNQFLRCGFPYFPGDLQWFKIFFFSASQWNSLRSSLVIHLFSQKLNKTVSVLLEGAWNHVLLNSVSDGVIMFFISKLKLSVLEDNNVKKLVCTWVLFDDKSSVW